MKKFQRMVPGAWVCGAALAGPVVGGIPVTAWAQPAVADHAEAEAVEPLAFDLATLLTDPNVLARPQDGVWRLEPMPGRVFVQLPFRVLTQTVTDPVTVKAPPVTLRGARWVAWRLTPAADGIGSPDGGGGGGGGGGASGGPSGGGGGGGVPVGAPLVARSFEVLPGGVVAWPLERALGGMDVNASGGSDYLLKLRPDRLREMAPERPGRSSSRDASGGSRPDAAARRAAQAAQAQAAAEYRQRLHVFNETRQRVLDLQDRFSAPMADGVVYALYEVPEFPGRVELVGPEPLPWVVQLDRLAQLRQIAQSQDGGFSGGRDGGFSGGAERSEALMETLQSAGEAGQIMAAEAMRLGGYAAGMTPSDPLGGVLSSVIQTGTPAARQAVVRALAAVPPTPVTHRLLTDGLPHMSGDDKLAALSGLLQPGSSAQDTARQVLRTGQEFLADPTGPAPAQVLAQIQRVVSGRGGEDGDGSNGQHPGDADPALIQAVGEGMVFASLPGSRRSQAVAYVVKNAHEPLPAAWLGRGLLGAADKVLVNETLAALAERDLALPPAQIRSLNHHLVRLVDTDDQGVQQAALAVIDRFRVSLAAPDARLGSSSGGGLDAPGTDVVGYLLRVGMKQPQVPASVAGFAAVQWPNAQSADALVELALGTGPAAAHAARLAVGCGQPLGAALAQRPVDDRTAFAAAVYASWEKKPGPVIGLLEEPPQRSSVATWFGDRVASPAGLPAPADWAAAAGGERGLLQQVASGSPRVQLAAVDALLASVGGAREASVTVLTALGEANGDPDGMAQIWQRQKRAIFSARIAEAAGAYRLSLEVYNRSLDAVRSEAARRAGGASGSREPAVDEPELDGFQDGAFSGQGRGVPADQVIQIATVQLIVDGQEVRLSNGSLPLEVSDERLALSVLSLRDLRFFDLDALLPLPLDRAPASLDLLPQANGVWAGWFEMGAQQSGRLRLTPVSKQ